MRVNYQPLFKKQLKIIQLSIAKDKVTAARKFVKELKVMCENIVNMPYKHRQSIYHDNKNSRDMIFKGYTITYEISEDKIIIETIFNQNLPLADLK